MSNFRSIDRQTGFLLPPSVDEWLPGKHLARFVVEVIRKRRASPVSARFVRGNGDAGVLCTRASQPLVCAGICCRQRARLRLRLSARSMAVRSYRRNLDACRLPSMVASLTKRAREMK